MPHLRNRCESDYEYRKARLHRRSLLTGQLPIQIDARPPGPKGFGDRHRRRFRARTGTAGMVQRRWVDPAEGHCCAIRPVALTACCSPSNPHSRLKELQAMNAPIIDREILTKAIDTWYSTLSDEILDMWRVAAAGNHKPRLAMFAADQARNEPAASKRRKFARSTRAIAAPKS
jgi:hypothetical protein